MYEIMKALYEIGFSGPIRPDHGRMIWDEVAMPGYGLYDRALGAAYLNGLWEAIKKRSWQYMKLDKPGLTFRKDWEEKGYSLPEYDREAVAQYTHEHPQWIHFGAGNIFRAFQANLAQTLLNLALSAPD